MPVRLQLFGSPTLECDGTSIALPFERRSQLVVLLALRRAWVSRAELAAMLWPDQSPKLAFGNLRKTLFRLQDLPWGRPLETQGGSLRFVADSDVQAFELALHEQRPADALALHAGTLLAGFDDDANEAWTGWLRFERDRLHAAWRTAALAHLASDTADDLGLSTRLLEADPLDETALRTHMALLARAGQAVRARQVYREFVERLADELGITPGPELQALHDALGRPAAAAAPKITVHFDDGGFVGRSAERRRIADLLTGNTVRLLSVTGPGGIGKTRLVQRALHDLAPAFPDGAVFVPLDDVAAAGELAVRIARETGTALRGRTAPLEQLAAALGNRQWLLVLDNFEQLVDEAAALQALLGACPRLRLLVTSRVRLGLAAEQLLPLEGLPCPEAEDVDRIDAFDAARLFVSAARRVEPALSAATEAAAIVEICRQVDGLPLALELAAAWTRMLSCSEIAAELREGTELLRATDAAHPPRHASIEQVFEQSWRRLADTERAALARLSVFHGGFSAEAARAVTGTPLPVLGALADKSLLRKSGPRLSLHPLVQQLAAMRLGELAGAATRTAHAAYCHRLLAQLEPASEVGERPALEAIDREFENLRVAWQFALAHGAADVLRRSAATLLNFFEHRARFEDGLVLWRQALAAPLCRRDTALQALLTGQAALLEYRLGRLAEAQADAVLALAAAGRDRDARLQALAVLASCATASSEFPAARRHFKQALALARAGGMPHSVAAMLENLAIVEKRSGRYDEALRLSTESLAQHRRNGNGARLALSLSNLASLSMFMDHNDAAAAHLHEALALSERHGLVSTRAFVLANLSELALKLKDVPTARAHAERSLEVAEPAGMRSLASWLKAQLARLAAQQGELARARVLLAEATVLAQALAAASLQAAVLLGLADLFDAQGDTDLARRVLAFAADEASLTMPDRDELRFEWARRVGTQNGPDPAWPGITLAELLHRVIAEAALAHAPLAALLRGSAQTPAAR